MWGCYIALALAGTAWSVLLAIASDDFDQDTVGLLSGLQVTFGLLLVTIYAPTALAEERARGSLDVLMTTPLSTDRIVLAKWWGAYRVVPALALLPAIGALIVGFTHPQIPAEFTQLPQPHDPIGWIDRLAFACLPTAFFLAQGAAVASFGLALATWIPRVGRAIAASVAAYAIFAFGWPMLLEEGIVPSILSWVGLVRPDDQDAMRFCAMIEVSICPLAAQITPFLSVQWAAALSRYAFYVGHVIVLLLTIGVAFLFLGLTLATFNRSMGRMPERPAALAPAATNGQSGPRAASRRSRIAWASSGPGSRLIPFVNWSPPIAWFL